MNLDLASAVEKGNMSALEEKVDVLMRYCVADSAQLRRHYHGDLQAMLGHADISSTQMYANMSRKAGCNDVYDRCHPLAVRAK